ncbi:MAG: hypothetical protein MUE46_01510 [Xanthomonadales bacterium]|jgi:hypothetical protein|nr:hypothetical protein [Xanthomonadales bacterium]
MTGPLSAAHAAALHTVLDALAQAGVWYRATGGLAGNLHGSRWPLHDIDLDYYRADWPRIEAVMRPYLWQAPQAYRDAEFRLTLARARVGSVEIEFCQIEDCAVASEEGWRLLDIAPIRETRHWQGREVWTLPLADLVAYKSLMGREADLRELRSLPSRAPLRVPG